jgi:hypothetical protein
VFRDSPAGAETERDEEPEFHLVAAETGRRCASNIGSHLQGTGRMDLTTQILFLFVLALPIASVSWTVTHEDLFREPHEYCVRKSRESASIIARKFYYLFTCEYCFSHYVALLCLLVTRYQLLFQGWRGYVIGEFALVWISNQYISIYNRLRLTIQNERVEIETREEIREQVARPRSVRK